MSRLLRFHSFVQSHKALLARFVFGSSFQVPQKTQKDSSDKPPSQQLMEAWQQTGCLYIGVGLGRMVSGVLGTIALPQPHGPCKDLSRSPSWAWELVFVTLHPKPY